MMTYVSKPRGAAALFAAIAAAGLVACGGGDSARTDTAADAPATEAPAAEAPAADAPAAAATVANAEGEALYARCMACHQMNGEGVPGAFPPLAGSEWVTGNAEVPIRILLHGLQGEVEVKGQTYNGVMLAYGTGVEMNDREMAALVTYIRQSWGNGASAVTAEEVAAVRAATAGQSGPYSAADLASLR